MIKLRTIKTSYSFNDHSLFFGFGFKIWDKLRLFTERTLRLARSKIEIRLTLGYLPLVIAVVCISFISLKNLNTVNKINKNIIERDMVLLDAVDKILINDLVAVQKILDDQLQSEKSVSYLFVMNNRSVLVHTFSDGVPVNLVEINKNMESTKTNIIKFASETGERFVDIQWPIFDGKAGVLRVGLSEKGLREKVRQLRLKMTD